MECMNMSLDVEGSLQLYVEICACLVISLDLYRCLGIAENYFVQLEYLWSFEDICDFRECLWMCGDVWRFQYMLSNLLGCMAMP